jgi:hypothetical protein
LRLRAELVTNWFSHHQNNVQSLETPHAMA